MGRARPRGAPSAINPLNLAAAVTATVASGLLGAVALRFSGQGKRGSAKLKQQNLEGHEEAPAEVGCSAPCKLPGAGAPAAARPSDDLLACDLGAPRLTPPPACDWQHARRQAREQPGFCDSASTAAFPRSHLCVEGSLSSANSCSSSMSSGGRGGTCTARDGTGPAAEAPPAFTESFMPVSPDNCLPLQRQASWASTGTTPATTTPTQLSRSTSCDRGSSTTAAPDSPQQPGPEQEAAPHVHQGDLQPAAEPIPASPAVPVAAAAPTAAPRPPAGAFSPSLTLGNPLFERCCPGSAPQSPSGLGPLSSSASACLHNPCYASDDEEAHGGAGYDRCSDDEDAMYAARYTLMRRVHSFSGCGPVPLSYYAQDYGMDAYGEWPEEGREGAWGGDRHGCEYGGCGWGERAGGRSGCDTPRASMGGWDNPCFDPAATSAEAAWNPCSVPAEGAEADAAAAAAAARAPCGLLVVVPEDGEVDFGSGSVDCGECSADRGAAGDECGECSSLDRSHPTPCRPPPLPSPFAALAGQPCPAASPNPLRRSLSGGYVSGIPKHASHACAGSVVGAECSSGSSRSGIPRLAPLPQRPPAATLSRSYSASAALRHSLSGGPLPTPRAAHRTGATAGSSTPVWRPSGGNQTCRPPMRHTHSPSTGLAASAPSTPRWGQRQGSLPRTGSAAGASTGTWGRAAPWGGAALGASGRAGAAAPGAAGPMRGMARCSSLPHASATSGSATPRTHLPGGPRQGAGPSGNALRRASSARGPAAAGAAVRSSTGNLQFDSWLQRMNSTPSFMRATRASLARADTLLLKELAEGPGQELGSQRRLSSSGMAGTRRTWR